ncbi:MAG: histone deacetylase [Gaiellales bacterium]
MELLSHPDFARRHPTGDHPESPERLHALQEALDYSVTTRTATVEELAVVHDREYVASIESASLSGHVGYLDPDTVCTPSSYGLALLAAGAAIEAVSRGGFALVRPPGHHARPDRAMGFCLFNNAAVATRYAQRELGLRRIAILDWDVHHGNGTDEMFRGDETVLFVSLHRWPFYPGTGGPGDGNETTLNVPISEGAGDDQYLETFERVVEPAIAAFAPDLLLVSAGFDAAAGDPLGGMLLTGEGFRELGRRAAALCGSVAAVLEGGYNVETLPGLVAAARDGLGTR